MRSESGGWYDPEPSLRDRSAPTFAKQKCRDASIPTARRRAGDNLLIIAENSVGRVDFIHPNGGLEVDYINVNLGPDADDPQNERLLPVLYRSGDSILCKPACRVQQRLMAERIRCHYSGFSLTKKP